MLRGDVYWVTFRRPDKRRPVLIVTRTSALTFLTSITIAPLTTNIRDIPCEVELTPFEDGVLQHCVVNCDNLQTITKRALEQKITTLSFERMEEVNAAITYALGMDSFLYT